jgi:LacI family transcriptional regulator
MLAARQRFDGQAAMNEKANHPTPDVGRAKLADVARSAMVSLATASRVLNRPEIVKPEVRERVLAAVRALSYSPDRTAQALISGKSFIVGAIVPTLGNAIFADGVETLQDRLSENGYTLLLSNSQYDLGKELRQIKALLGHGVDGLVLTGDTFAPEAVPIIRQRGVPCVTTYVAESKNGLPSIGIDNRQATYDLTRYLLDLEHREFGIISNTTLPNDRSQARLAGMLAALTDAGIALERNRIVEVAKPLIANGCEGLRRLLDAHPAITAVLCTTDALAVGALAEARRMGIEVPDALSVSGFDDVEIASGVSPSLTTVNVPAARIGRLAAEHLVRAMAGDNLPIVTRFEAKLVIRDSTGRAPRAKAAQRRSRRISLV